MTVTDLGRWVVSGNSASHAVKLVNADGTDVSNGGATVRTAGMTAGRFAYAPLAAPVTLSAYTSYFVVSQEAVGGDQWYDYANTPITLTAAGGALAISAPNGSTAYTLASNGAGKTFGPVNLEFASGLTGGSWAFAQEVRYLYDGRRVIQERDGSNAPTVSYTRGKDLSGTLEGAGGIGGLLARSSGYNSSTGAWSTHYYYHADGNGNITYLVDGSQGLAASYEYDPYGTILSSSGTMASANVYRFSSKEFHSNSGLYYYGYRFYDPNLQRWVNRDPLGDLGHRKGYQQRPHRPTKLSEPGLLDMMVPIEGLGETNPFKPFDNSPSDNGDPDGQWALIVPIVVIVIIGGVGWGLWKFGNYMHNHSTNPPDRFPENPDGSPRDTEHMASPAFLQSLQDVKCGAFDAARSVPGVFTGPPDVPQNDLEAWIWLISKGVEKANDPDP